MILRWLRFSPSSSSIVRMEWIRLSKLCSGSPIPIITMLVIGAILSEVARDLEYLVGDLGGAQVWLEAQVTRETKSTGHRTAHLR